MGLSSISSIASIIAHFWAFNKLQLRLCLGIQLGNLWLKLLYVQASTIVKDKAIFQGYQVVAAASRRKMAGLRRSKI